MTHQQSHDPADELAFPREEALRVVRLALDEDLGALYGTRGVDVTTAATITPDQRTLGRVVARADGVLCGGPVIGLALDEVADRLGCPRADVAVAVPDGSHLVRGQLVATISGSTQATLLAERTVLNILSRMSGVATHTDRWTDELEGSGTTVLDTRKTTPGLRALEKYAVRCGGGTNKRMGLFDVAMVKDNHKLAAGGLTAAYEAIRQCFPDVLIQVEVTTAEEALEAVGSGARFLLCDNMSVDLLAATVDAVRGTGDDVEIEATGGLTLEAAAAYAATGVDYLSVGALTHSSPVLDIALDIDAGR